MILLAEHQSSVKKQKYIQMTHAHVAVVKNTNNAAAVRLKTAQFKYKKEVNLMVELDQFKFILNGYEGPLVELRDSL